MCQFTKDEVGQQNRTAKEIVKDNVEHIVIRDPNNTRKRCRS